MIRMNKTIYSCFTIFTAFYFFLKKKKRKFKYFIIIFYYQLLEVYKITTEKYRTHFIIGANMML